MSVKDTDKGLRDLLKRIKASKLAITVGVHAEEGAGTYPDGATVADVASYNEFGTERIPARPFISGWFDTNRPVIEAQLKKAGERITKGQDANSALDMVAQWSAGQVQKGISAGLPPPNAPSTVAQKGSSVPLVNSGQLRSSIRGRVGNAG